MLSRLGRVELSESEITFLCRHPWEITRDELAGAVKADNMSPQELISELVHRGASNSLVASWFADDEPIAVVGAVESANANEFLSFFFASKHFAIHGSKTTRAIRRWLIAAQEKYRDHKLVTVSRSPHPARDKWFATLRFKASETQSRPGRWVYIYQPS